MTRNDVARLARVVPSTVSYVVNNGPRPVSAEARDRVLKAIAKLGYHPSEVARSTGVVAARGVAGAQRTIQRDVPRHMSPRIIGVHLDDVDFGARAGEADVELRHVDHGPRGGNRDHRRRNV